MSIRELPQPKAKGMLAPAIERMPMHGVDGLESEITRAETGFKAPSPTRHKSKGKHPHRAAGKSGFTMQWNK